METSTSSQVRPLPIRIRFWFGSWWVDSSSWILLERWFTYSMVSQRIETLSILVTNGTNDLNVMNLSFSFSLLRRSATTWLSSSRGSLLFLVLSWRKGTFKIMCLSIHCDDEDAAFSTRWYCWCPLTFSTLHEINGKKMWKRNLKEDRWVVKMQVEPVDVNSLP